MPGFSIRRKLTSISGANAMSAVGITKMPTRTGIDVLHETGTMNAASASEIGNNNGPCST
jgi:hypothetical protein